MYMLLDKVHVYFIVMWMPFEDKSNKGYLALPCFQNKQRREGQLNSLLTFPVQSLSIWNSEPLLHSRLWDRYWQAEVTGLTQALLACAHSWLSQSSSFQESPLSPVSSGWSSHPAHHPCRIFPRQPWGLLSWWWWPCPGQSHSGQPQPQYAHSPGHRYRPGTTPLCAAHHHAHHWSFGRWLPAMAIGSLGSLEKQHSRFFHRLWRKHQFNRINSDHSHLKANGSLKHDSTNLKGKTGWRWEPLSKPTWFSLPFNLI